MPATASYDYAVVRVVPRVDREEFVNTGVVLFSKENHFLAVSLELNESRLRAFNSSLDLELVRRHLDAIKRICAGEKDAGPIAQLSLSQRFQWLVAPRSTIIQMSPVHSGLCVDPATTLQDLVLSVVAT